MLQRTYELYQDKGVVFVGIAVKDIESDSLAFMEEFSVTYPNVMDIGGHMEDEYRTTGVPETFVVDKDGNLTSWYYFPNPTESELISTIEEALNG